MKLAVVAIAAAIVTLATNQTRPEIDLTAVRSYHQIPQAPAGRAGDTSVGHWSLRDRHGNTIGAGDLNCRWIRAERRMCVGELRLPLGTIEFAGSSQTRNRGLFAVTGGTGHYRGAKGDLSFNETGVNRLTVIVTL